ncbi:glycosyl hydrolase family 5 [Sphingobium yanoikuyae]|uniref:Glycosyl hydrolase family 5 n=1 Tax=Sphingobium yanoikuyae TaxID=13690 RepID=A0A291MYR8_SPHYA|nr:glycosyl hydrolase family 5 [Sphingobium yanoikuyae]
MACAEPPLSGINLAGGEFNSGRKPGIFGKDYIYPDTRTAAPFVAMGMKIVRVPILWERIQPVPLQPLSAAEQARLDKVVAILAPFRIIILDIHNYGANGGQRLDQSPDGSAKLADLWRRLAEHYRGNRQVAFGLMNEPNGMAPARWRSMVDESVVAIRKAGARNMLFVPGSNWTGAHSWIAGGRASNAAAFQHFRDPAGNYAIEMHQYLDSDSSGMKAQCEAPPVIQRRMEAATKWLRDNRHKGFLGEFGAPANAACLDSLDALLKHLDANADVWMGWAYWAGGPWWGANYPMSLQPVQGKARPQAAIVAKYSQTGAAR